jgi:large subunit ribosomal protein L6
MPVAAESRKDIEIPDGVSVKYESSSGNLTITGPLGTLTRTFNHPRINIQYKNNQINVSCLKPIKREHALVGTWAAHIHNMVQGVSKGFEYKMKIVYSHFPIKTHVKDNELIIENFLGEKLPRRAKIIGDTKVKISGDQIILTGSDIEIISQSVANIERATMIKNYDPRVFQDGIYLFEHPRKRVY